jgi:Protein of unknown function (DUF1822)
MTYLLAPPMEPRSLSPETIWLEPEQIAQAKVLSNLISDAPIPEAQRWQRYLNALAMLGFEQWLAARLPEQAIIRLSPLLDSVVYLEVSGFRFCLITVEHVLDERISIPQAVVERSDLVSDFYVVQEVSEEQELITMRGFCHYDELIQYRDRQACAIQDECYLLPLSFLDAEINHILFYCRSLQPMGITLPDVLTSVSDRVLEAVTRSTTRLTQWLQGVVEEQWQMMEQLINPEAYLSFSTRSIEAGTRRGKLINLGVVLLVNLTSEAEGKLGVLVQLHPTGSATYLRPEIILSLRSATGKTLQTVTARSQDNYIQLKPFKGNVGTCFTVSIQSDRESVEENFEL